MRRPAEAELQGRGARGNFREIASNRPRKRSAFGNCTKIGGLWPDKYLSRLPNRESAALAKFLDSPHQAASPCLHSVFTGDMARDPFPDKPDRAREKSAIGAVRPHAFGWPTLSPVRYLWSLLRWEGQCMGAVDSAASVRSKRFRPPRLPSQHIEVRVLPRLREKNKDDFRAVARKSH